MKRKTLSLLIVTVMLLGLLPQPVLAEEMTIYSGSTGNMEGTILTFAPLADGVCSQKVDRGAERDSLILPSTLLVTVQACGEDDMLMEAQERELSGFSWRSEPEYDPLTVGEYCFTPVLPVGWSAEDGVALPYITAVVSEADEAVTLLDMTLLSSSPETFVFDISEGNITVATSGAGLLTVTYGAGATATFDRNQEFMITGSSADNSVMVNSNVNAKIAISGINISSPFQIAAFAAVELTVIGTNNLDDGLRVPVNANLTITAASTGILTAAGSGDAAGIGGGGAQIGGAININGGTVNVTSNGNGAGIGGGSAKRGGTININAGTVNVISNGNGAGIGGGYTGAGGFININGGTVNVTTGPNNKGAGIGGGNALSGGTIKITGGEVTVNTGSNSFGAGIGGGDNGDSGTIQITNGVVHATTNGRGAAIGGGWGKGCNISISGGTVTATSNSYGAGIGAGEQSSAATVYISGGDVTAETNFVGAGIGGGIMGSGGNITIISGRVTVTTGVGSSGAGIGGGYQGGSGNITINGGVVTVNTAANSHGAGIGSGYQSPAGGSITVNGGIVSATANGNGAGIGGGFQGINGTITISNGIVTAIAGASSLGAGIGGSWSGEAGSIIINGGTVNAISNGEVAAIGGGNGRPGGIISIAGGTVNATSNSGGASIGGGTGGSGGTITITGGAVYATTGSGGAGIGGGTGGSGGIIQIGGGIVYAESNGSGAGIGGGSIGSGGDIMISGGFTEVAGSRSTIGIGFNGTAGTVSKQNAIVIENTTGQVYGNAVLRDNASILAGKNLTIDSGNSLTLDVGVTLTNNGSLYNNGTVGGSGTIQNNGLIVNTNTFTVTVAGNPVRKPLTGSMVQNISLQTYTGFALTPPVTIVDGGTTLELHVDYEVAYNSNINTGTGAAIVTGIGRYIYEVSKNFSILKGNPVYTTPSGLTATYGQTLADVSLPTRYNWENPLSTLVGSVGSNSFTVRYTPVDTSNYNSVTGIPVSIAVGKARQDFTTPAGLSATYGQTLADVSLPSGFSWDNPSGTSVGGAGSNNFTVTYTPTDTTNYNTVTGIPVTVTVGKTAPNMLLTATNGILALDSTTLTATVTGVEGEPLTGSVTFKKGSSTLGSVMLVNGAANYTWNDVPAGSYTLTAEYGGNGNYNVTSASIAGYLVNKRSQAPLVISGVPPTTSYGDGRFILAIAGGSGSGSVTLGVTSGVAVQVDVTGDVTVMEVGQAVITAVKAGDEVYNSSTVSVTIDVRKAIPAITIAPTASAIQSGSLLSSSTLTGGAITGVDGTALTGVFLWSNPASVITSTGNYEVTFSPDNSANYDIAAVMVPLTVMPKSASPHSRSTTVITQMGSNPGRPVIAQLAVAPTADDNGHAAGTVNEGSAADAVAKALEDAKSIGQTVSGIGIAVNVNLPETARSFGITLPLSVLNRFVDAGVRQLEINDEIVNLRFDLEALKEFRNKSTGDVTITVRPAHDISDAAKKLIGTRPVYDVIVNYEKDGKTVAIGNMNQGGITIYIPYVPNQNETVGYLFGVYVDGSGRAIRIPASKYDADSRSIILNSSHFSVYGVGYAAPSEKYTDVATHWARESIDYAVGLGLFGGTAETTFSPDTEMDRGMLVTVLGRLAGADVSAYEARSFTDVAASQYCLPYVEWAYKKGIVQGTGGGRFDPKRSVTRQEFAVILQNYARTAGYTLPVTRDSIAFADSSSIGDGYLGAVKAMLQAGIMMGVGSNRFEPKGGATRAEVAVMLNRYIKLTDAKPL